MLSQLKVLYRWLPNLRSLPSPAQLELTSRQLMSEISLRTTAQYETLQKNEELRRRLTELETANTRLRLEVEERTQAEKSLVRREYELRRVADEANRAKSVFLANMSHEIRTPIGVMLGCAERLLRVDLKREQRHRCAEMIHRNGATLLALVNDILDLSKVEAGHLALEKGTFALIDFICDTVGPMRMKAEEKGLSLVWSTHGKVPERIESDPIRLRQILGNLLSNAIKFTHVGEITLTVSTILNREGHEMLRFTVADTGIGIDDQAQQRLFQPFLQADHSIARKYGGTGLGLHLSQHLARMLGGDVTLLHSQLNEGSVFALVLDPGDLRDVEWKEILDPANAELERLKTRERSIQSETDLTDLRVLLVEDFQDSQEIIKAILIDQNAVVDLAENGQEALAKAQGQSYDVILMDLQMPVMDGYTATRELRQQGFKEAIIALTAHAMRGERERCLALGFTNYLSKPIDRQLLLKTLIRARRGDNSEPPPVMTESYDEADNFPILSRLRDDPVIAAAIPKFVNKLPDRMQSMRAYFEHADWESLRVLAHQLKGAGGGFGFPEITTCAQQIEEQAPGTSAMSSLIKQMEVLCGRIYAGREAYALAQTAAEHRIH